MSGAGIVLPGWLASLPRPFASPRTIERYQATALRRLVDHAWRRVPFYRRRLEAAGLRPEDIRVPADLQRLPPTSTRELQQVPLPDRMASDVRPSDCVEYWSSGSTGEPLRTLRTPREDALLFGLRLRAQILSGLRPWHLRVYLGSPRRLFRWHRIGAFRIHTLSDRSVDDHLLDQILALEPDVLMVGPESLELLVGQVRPGAPRRLRHLFTGANQLGPSLRRRAEEALGARVTDFYGTNESNLVAWQCHRCGCYHTVDDGAIVEVVRDDGRPADPGETGEVLVTALHSFAMPYLRLRLGDVARRPLAPDRCPLRFGRLERIEGRSVDYLSFPGGRVSPFAVLDQIEPLEGLGRWQAVQQAETLVEIRFVPLPGADEDELGAAIGARLRALLPPEVSIEVRAVRQIDVGTGSERAKHRYVRSMSP